VRTLTAIAPDAPTVGTVDSGCVINSVIAATKRSLIVLVLDLCCCRAGREFRSESILPVGQVAKSQKSAGWKFLL
jgi:hypothetical protein